MLKSRSLARRFERAILGVLPQRLQVRLRSAHQAQKSVLRSVVWLAILVAIAKSVAAIKEVAVAYRFGTTAELEGYLLIFTLVTWPVSLALSVLQAVFVPRLVRWHNANSDQSHVGQREIAAWVWMIGIVAGILMYWLLPSVIRSGALGLAPEAREAAVYAVPWMVWVVPAGVVGGWHACQLMSRQRHANTLLEGVPAAAIAVAVLWMPTAKMEALLWGTGLGFAAQLLLLMLFVHAADMPVRPALQLSRSADHPLLSNATILLGAQVLMGLGGVIDQIILAHMPAGSLAAFGYANRVMALVLTLSATVAGRALLPVLSGLDAQRAYAVARRWAWLLFRVGGVAAVLLAFMAEPIVSLLFERGAFTQQDTDATSVILLWLVMSLPLYVAAIVWYQYMVAAQKTGWWYIQITLWGLVLKWTAVAGLFYLLQWTGVAVAVGHLIFYAVFFLTLAKAAKRDHA